MQTMFKMQSCQLAQKHQHAHLVNPYMTPSRLMIPQSCRCIKADVPSDGEPIFTHGNIIKVPDKRHFTATGD